ncbi:MAG: hypothetical protein CMH57_09825 [Myxococcales bacterium]|nr:hypothetical protein [Myxococcales bacterium]
MDEERFASHKLYQTILPSVTVSKLGELAAQLDRRYAGGELSRLLERFDDAIMPFWDGIHSVGMRNTEEDEALFVFQKASIGLCLWLPAIEELRTAVLLDHWPDDERQQVVAYYRDCIRRHVFAQGGRRFLGKNVLASGRIGTLLEAFPSAGIVYLVRHPYEAIPSFVSMFSAPWVNHSPDIGESAPEHRQLAGIAIAMYRHAFAMCQELPPERVLPIRYQDLVADPVKTVERIYGHFGMEASPGYAAKLRSEVQVSKNYKSTHAYSLEGYGLTREEIHASLKDVFEAYGFEP